MCNLISGCLISYTGVTLGSPTTNSVKKHKNSKPFANQTMRVKSEDIISTEMTWSVFLRAASGFNPRRGLVEIMWAACRLPGDRSHFSLAIPRFLACWAHGSEWSGGQPQVFPPADSTHCTGSLHN